MTPAAPNASILVVQGTEATQLKAAALAEMCGAPAAEALGPHVPAHAWRLRGATRREGVAAWCDAHRLDHAWIPEGRRFADLRLLAMDMDSTLISIECIDEIGGFINKKDEIAAITSQAMRGEINYAQSLRSRVALLAGLDEEVLEDVYDEKLRLSPGAEALVAACKNHGIKVILVSSGFTLFTERLKARLGLDDTLSNVLEIDNGKLTGRILGTIVDGDAKAAKFRHMA
ncbi:MAG: phosphoserine phosphatase SerB, partial [Betaproteobacteria bacterium RBG_16_66_20]